MHRQNFTRRLSGVAGTAGGRRLLTLVLACFLVPAWFSAALRAHEVPTEVLIRVLVKAEGSRLRVLIRVPMAAMQDVDFPTRGPGYLNIPDADPGLRQAAMSWVARELDLYENGERLQGQQLTAVMASLPSDRSFASYDQALAHVLGPKLPASTEIVWQQSVLDMLYEYPIRSDRSDFAIDPTLGRLGQRTQTVMQYVRPDGRVRAFDYRGNPGLVPLDPGWSEAALRFVRLGFDHILDGIDHLLFLACLVIPVRRLRPLVAVVTSFAVAHSVTLIASAYNLAPDTLWFQPLIELLIALSIVYMAVDSALGLSSTRRWPMVFAFGLVHGFGLAFGLRETLQFGGGHTLAALIGFNAGVELGLLLAIGFMAAAASLLFRTVFAARERAGVIVLSAFAGSTAWNWTLERGSTLWQYNIVSTRVRCAGACCWRSWRRSSG
jgi:hypothetical protein